MAIKLYIGLMSGTSADGIDASLIETDGRDHFKPIANYSLNYEASFQTELLALYKNYHKFLDIEIELTVQHAQAVNNLLENSKFNSRDIEAIGFHGQAIHHAPHKGITWQIGNPYILAEKTGINVVYDFRRRDVARGGNGAPLIPIFLKCLASSLNKPCAFLNIGGVANISYIDNDEIIGFDTGPGNSLIDDIMHEHFNEKCDLGGRVGLSGKIDYNITAKLLQDEYFKRKYPKSLDRNYFTDLAKKCLSLEIADQVATLTYFSVKSIAYAVEQLPKQIKELYISGGGYNNSFMMELLSTELEKQNVKIISTNEKFNLDSNFIESQGFAYFAARNIENLPCSFPSTTGVNKPTICGQLVKF